MVRPRSVMSPSSSRAPDSREQGRGGETLGEQQQQTRTITAITEGGEKRVTEVVQLLQRSHQRLGGYQVDVCVCACARVLPSPNGKTYNPKQSGRVTNVHSKPVHTQGKEEGGDSTRGVHEVEVH